MQPNECAAPALSQFSLFVVFFKNINDKGDLLSGLVVMSNVPYLRNEEHLRKGGKKLLVAGVEAQCCPGRGLTVHHWPRGGWG
jgi:hypothetical protein